MKETKKMYDASREEIYDIKGDAQSGISMGYDMEKTKIGEPCVRYRDRLIWPDVYEMDKHLMVIWRCPRCTHDSNITSHKKRIEYTPGSRSITIEPFGCRWDGCGLKISINNSVAKDYQGPL
jgi:hypothetical protein